MDAWKPKLTMKEKICEALWKTVQYLSMVALLEAMIFMFVLMA